MNEEELAISLKEKYNPISIIVHGSYARGNALPNSDIDIYLIVPDPAESSKDRLRNFEHSILDIAFLSKKEAEEDDINERFGFNLSDAKVIFDTESLGENLLKRAQEFYKKGRNLTQEERQFRKYFFERCLGRLKDTTDDSISFEIRFGEIYGRLPRYWAELKMNTWGKSPRVAILEIQQKDEYYSRLLMSLTKASKEEKIQLLEECFRYLFD